MKLVAPALVVACASCNIPLRSADADLFYDTQGMLGYCSGGAMLVEQGDAHVFTRVLGREWQVRQAQPLPDCSGYVFRSRVDAPTHGWIPTMADATTELWLLRGDEHTPRRLTHNVAHESQIVVLPDSSGVAFAQDEASNGWGFTRPGYEFQRLDFASGEIRPVARVWDLVGTLANGTLAVRSYVERSVRHRDSGELVSVLDSVNGFLDPDSGTVEIDTSIRAWNEVDWSGRTFAWSAWKSSPDTDSQRFVHWLDRQNDVEIVFEVGDDLLDFALAPDGERIAIAVRGDVVAHAMVVGAAWAQVTVREFDRAGGLLRTIGL